MNLKEALNARHSVRTYESKPIDPLHIKALGDYVKEFNGKSGLHMQLVLGQPRVFNNFRARYGKITSAQNCLALVGQKASDLHEKCGYWGEHVVLRAQQLGLNSCWVGGMFTKASGIYDINPGEKLVLVVALGYGTTQGHERKSKSFDDVAHSEDDIPPWFYRGVEAALLAPTAINQQKFHFALKGDFVEATTHRGPFSKVDLGIAKYHFEIGSERAVWESQLSA